MIVNIRNQKGSTENSTWCYCMTCVILSSVEIGSTYTVLISTNVVVDTKRYGDVPALDFTWSYNPWWGTTTDGALGTSRTVTSTVANNTFKDVLQVGVWADTVWNGSFPVIAASPNSYVHLAINITFARQFADKLGYFVKDAKFEITTPTTSGSAGSTSISSGGSTSTNSSGESSSRSSSNTGAIAGGVVGAVTLTVTCAAVGFVIRRKKIKGKVERSEESGDNAEGPGADDAPPPPTPAFVIPTPSPGIVSGTGCDNTVTTTSESPPSNRNTMGLDLFGYTPTRRLPSLPPPPYDYDGD
ncbi:hypothetical protein FRC14_004753 [Serendipita sp. 396]|nr:hypothetical protein FRC14_004753 [Serendipita sp. 396]KAG8804599.1 hypothetical protein FRC16_006041 [Serendipita sp. 398]